MTLISSRSIFQSSAILLVVALLLVFQTVPVQGDDSSSTTNGIIELTSEEFYALTTVTDEGPQIDAVLDVRTQGEWDTVGHIANATLVENLGPTLGDSNDLRATLQDLNLWACRNCRIIVYCRSGARASVALNLLREAGFQGQLYNGLGTSQWLAAGYELVTTPSQMAPCMEAAAAATTKTLVVVGEQKQGDVAFCRLPTAEEEEEKEESTELLSTAPPSPTPTSLLQEEEPELSTYFPTFEGQETEASLLEHQLELDINRDLFVTKLAMNNAAAYQFDFTLTCFCLPAGYPWTVTVELEYNNHNDNSTMTSNSTNTNSTSTSSDAEVIGDKPVSIITTEGQDILQTQDTTYLNTYSILDLFDKIQDAIDRKAHDITVLYNREWGFPERITIDYNYMMVDEELYVTVNHFRLVKDPNNDIGDDMETTNPLQMEFDQNYDLWTTTAGSQEYYFQYSWITGILLDFPWSVHVQDGTVSSVNDANGEDVIMMPGADRTIEDVFDAVQRGIEEKAVTFQVTYDETYGYPKEVWIDFDERIADEEISIQVSYFSTEGFPTEERD